MLCFCCLQQLGKTKYHKSHHFDVCNETSMMVGEAKPGIGGEPLPGQKVKPRSSKFPKGEGSNLPAWVAFDRQVGTHRKYILIVINAYTDDTTLLPSIDVTALEMICDK